jgi:hypothetical protein
MLFGLGFVILLLSACVVSDSVLVPAVVALIGIGLMAIGNKREENGNGNGRR